jgi:drug/metabolite transporter (DMT)-like permease
LQTSRRSARALPAAPLWPVLGLTCNALVWGLSWWPFRQLQALGLHPLWATVIVYLLAVIAILVARPKALGQLVRTPALWVLLVASGTTNAAFNWAMVIGDVVRVVLLFYLMPLWAVLLARRLLRERLTLAAALRVLLALAGAAVVLAPAGGGWPWPSTLPDALALIGGFSFALNNVMLRREAGRPEEGRALAMFAGGVMVAGALALVLALGGRMAWPAAPAGWVIGALALSVLFLVSNLALQYGASRLPANVTAVVMLTEVVFAAGSALLLGGGRLTVPVATGGALIVTAALLAAFERRR